MAIRIRYQYSSGYTLGYSIERLADGLLYDFSTSAFSAAPTTLIASLPADTGNFSGRYKVNLSSTSATQFVDGDYLVTIHNTVAGNAVVAQLGVVMHSGDDATVIPSAGGADPLAQLVPGAYAAGTAGYILGTNLDAKISSRLATTSYVAPPSDYQQRTQPVVLPSTPPAWFVTASVAPTVAQIVAGVWDEPRSGHVSAGSFGSCLDVAVSSRLATIVDSPGTSTLLSRLSASRASYLDALNINGLVASHADAAAIQNNTLVRVFVPDLVQRPASGSISRIIHLYTYDEQGNMATPDTAPLITVASGSGVSRVANLDSTTMSLVSTGHYKSTYTLNASDPSEQLVWGFTVLQNGQARQYGGITEVVDISTVDFNSNDRANLNALVAMAGTTGVVVDPASKAGYTLAAQEHTAITADAVAALNTAKPTAPTAGSIFANIDAPISSRSTYAGGPVAAVVAPVVVGQNNDKAGYALAAYGLDGIPVEPGVNVRQSLAPILAASAGVLTGAGTGTVRIKGGNVTTTRIVAATDNAGNRSTVVLTLPT